jgi:hypothetical protein
MVLLITLKSLFNDLFNNKIPGIKNLTLSPFAVDNMVKIRKNNKIPTIKNKIIGPFRFVKPKFLCTLKPRYNDPFNNKIPAIKN